MSTPTSTSLSSEKRGRVDRRYVYALLVSFCLGWIVLGSDRTLLYPLLDRVALDLHLSSTQTGTVASSYFLLLVLTQFPVGVLGDKIGFKPLLVALYMLSGLALLALGLWATGYALLLLFVALHGVGVGVYYPSVYTLTIRTVPEKMRGFSTAMVNAGLAGGMGIGLVIAGPLFEFSGGWRAPFIIMSVPTVIMAAVYFFLVRGAKPAGTPTRLPAYRPLLLSIFRNRNLTGLFAANFCSLYCFWVVMVWGPAFFQSERNVGMAGSGMYVALAAAIAIPAGMVTGRISDRVGRRRLSWVMFLFNAASIALIATSKSAPAFTVGLVGYGLAGKLAWDPVQISWLGDHASRGHAGDLGLVISICSILSMSSSIIGPMVSGLIRDLTGSLQGAFYLGVVLALVGALITARLGETVSG